jgi:hypothetical protein
MRLKPDCVEEHAVPLQETPQVVDSLNLTEKDYNQLVDWMNRGAIPPRGDQRHEPRLKLDQGTILLCQVCADEETAPVHFAVRPRDVSRSGVGFFHGQFIHPGQWCEATFIVDRRYGVRHEGRVSHCQHVTGRIHKIGIAFDQALALENLRLAEQQG